MKKGINGKGIRLPAFLIIDRRQVSPSELAELERAGEIQLSPDKKERGAELEVGGSVVARGKIKKRPGRIYFQIEEVYQ